jgi:hypothetical protein
MLHAPNHRPQTIKADGQFGMMCGFAINLTMAL